MKVLCYKVIENCSDLLFFYPFPIPSCSGNSLTFILGTTRISLSVHAVQAMLISPLGAVLCWASSIPHRNEDKSVRQRRGALVGMRERTLVLLRGPNFSRKLLAVILPLTVKNPPVQKQAALVRTVLI